MRACRPIVDGRFIPEISLWIVPRAMGRPHEENGKRSVRTGARKRNAFTSSDKSSLGHSHCRFPTGYSPAQRGPYCCQEIHDTCSGHGVCWNNHGFGQLPSAKKRKKTEFLSGVARRLGPWLFFAISIRRVRCVYSWAEMPFRHWRFPASRPSTRGQNLPCESGCSCRTG